ncbi:MAG: DUF6504 family protein [Kiritimatiellae bacterium]|nr:DUF6504 family protein [Kiritimatiellia bacterium]
MRSEQFISEPIKPVSGTQDAARMAAGEPGLPTEFIWRRERLIITKCIRTWRETGPCRNGSKEQYLRRHWYELEDLQNRILKISFDRNPRGKQKTARWRLYSLTEP